MTSWQSCADQEESCNLESYSYSRYLDQPSMYQHDHYQHALDLLQSVPIISPRIFISPSANLSIRHLMIILYNTRKMISFLKTPTTQNRQVSSHGLIKIITWLKNSPRRLLNPSLFKREANRERNRR
jgi:hypothetical protein